MIVTTGRNNGLCRLDSKIQKQVNEVVAVDTAFTSCLHLKSIVIMTSSRLDALRSQQCKRQNSCSETDTMEFRFDSRDVLCGRARLVGAKQAMQVGDRNLCCSAGKCLDIIVFTEASKLPYVVSRSDEKQ